MDPAQKAREASAKYYRKNKEKILEKMKEKRNSTERRPVGRPSKYPIEAPEAQVP
jgi:hypothetical protein